MKIYANLATRTYRDKKYLYQFMLKEDVIVPELTSTRSSTSSFPKETPAEKNIIINSISNVFLFVEALEMAFSYRLYAFLV